MGLLAKATTEQVVGSPLPLTHIHTQTSQGIKLGQQHQPETQTAPERKHLSVGPVVETFQRNLYLGIILTSTSSCI